MSYHRRETAPYLYSLCDQYAVCDRWFSSVMGPTWPNRYYLHAATADGHKINLPMGLTPPPTVWERLADRCIPAGYYYAGRIPWYSVTFPAKSFSGDDAVRRRRPSITSSPTPRAGRSRPSRSSIPDFGISDGHPPYDFGLCEAFLSSIHRALASQRPLAARADGRRLRRARRLLRSRAATDGPRSPRRLPPDRLSRAGAW